MKKDSEVKRYMQARKTGKSQKLAAAAAGMSERTGRKYEHMGTFPSQLKQPRTWLTRKNPFEQDWDWVVAELERDPALQATTLLARYFLAARCATRGPIHASFPLFPFYPSISPCSHLLYAFVGLTGIYEDRQKRFAELIAHAVGLAATGCPIPPRWATGGCSHSLTLGNVSTAARQAVWLLSGAR